MVDNSEQAMIKPPRHIFTVINPNAVFIVSGFMSKCGLYSSVDLIQTKGRLCKNCRRVQAAAKAAAEWGRKFEAGARREKRI